MKILIIEDEESAAEQLRTMLAEYMVNARFEPVIDNIQDARNFLTGKPEIDLIFLDINLSDGLSFEIFRDTDIDIPVIFTTAYDQYAIQAFEVNSIDYILKPIRKERLVAAVNKFRKLEDRREMPDLRILEKVKGLLKQDISYKQNFLVPYKDRLIPLHISDIAWFELKNSLVRGVKFDKTAYTMEEKSLEELEAALDPMEFYRANRQYLISRKAIKDVQYHFNGRLFVNVYPEPDEKIIISKVKSGPFKEWMRSVKGASLLTQ
ncbi:MAG TPA: LytTR family DNA-binding domain-containing protein [Sphingobacteriaceae bacterium]